MDLLDYETFEGQAERAAQALDAANIALYPVDSEGLPGGVGLPDPAGAGPCLGFSVDPGLIGGMEQLAKLTGGKAFYFTNDIKGAIREAMDESRAAYTLAYTPTNRNWNGQFRKIKVKTLRRGVHLRYRPGYFATPETRLRPAERFRLMTEAEESRSEVRQVPLTLKASRIMFKGRPTIEYHITADAGKIEFSEAQGIHHADLTLAVLEKTETGRVVRRDEMDAAFNLDDHIYPGVSEKGLRMMGYLSLDRAATAFRVVLVDAENGHVGSLEIPIARMPEQKRAP
jgi:hypothetical protein